MFILRANAMIECMRAMEKQRNVGCQQGRSCMNPNEVHHLLWHQPDDVDDVIALIPSPLLEKIGGITELTSMRRAGLPFMVQAVRYLWHTPTCDGRLLASSLVDSRINVHAALVRHLRFTTSMYRDDAWEWGYPTPPNRKVPPLPGLTYLTCEPSSLSRRNADILASIFVPTLKRLDIGDGVAYETTIPTRLSHLRLTSITIGANSRIRSAEFERFLESATHVKSVKLGPGHEHLLIDRLVPILKSTEVHINDWDARKNSKVFEQLPKMRALEFVKITLTNHCFTGKDLLRLKVLSHLKHFKVVSASMLYGPRCTAAVEEVAECVEAMPDLDVFDIHVPCDFVDEVAEPHGEDWVDDQSFTFFPTNACRQQYLDYLHSLMQDKLDIALATFEHLPFCLHLDV
ncbi:hypothetical protein D6D19_06811 [Aureobasidium pullulans]|uniref:F-box domain-containing protein n=1 Tax=Aureobasidium pullulans TaxID=5580 RepID=A0A4S9KLS6_AURPU|nr:hypothetical protein D6D19_06811 [Aureobasidium pullulans]THY17071.1 hypothetical protein D6D00_08640 [Aureobasidium pullulans]